MRRKAGRTRIKNRWRPDEGMIESLIIAGACVLTVFLGFLLHLRWSIRFISQQFQILDEKIAQALKNTIENLPIGDVEPVNPMQMMLMQIIQDNMAKNPAKLVERDEKGLFTAKDPE